MGLPMPVHERFYKGTKWHIATGPGRYVGLNVEVVGEVFSSYTSGAPGAVLLVRVRVDPQHADDTSLIEFDADLSWLG